MEFISIDFFWDGIPLIIVSCSVILSLILMFISACVDHGSTNADIGIFVIALVAMICFSISAGSSRQRVRTQIDVSRMNLVDYQNLVDGINNTSLDGNILTIELSEEAFFRWYYRTHEPTISASSNTLLES